MMSSSAKKRNMSNQHLDQVQGILSEHNTNYVVIVLNEETNMLEYRFSNQMIGKMLCKEAVKDIETYEEDEYEMIWDNDEDEEETF